MVLPRETPRPGLPSAQELVLWMDSKMEKNQETIQSTLGGDCYASIKLQESLKYLRLRFFDKGIRSLEQVQSELEQHWAFYTEKLKWLAGAGNPSSFTLCEEGSMYCGLDGMCLDCAVF